MTGRSVSAGWPKYAWCTSSIVPSECSPSTNARRSCSDRSGRSQKYTLCTNTGLLGSEIELVDVGFGELQRRTEHDLAAANLHGAEPAGLERCRARRERPAHLLQRGVDGQIAEIARIPEHDRLHDA